MQQNITRHMKSRKNAMIIKKKKNSKNRPRKEPNIGVSVQGIQNNYK